MSSAAGLTPTPALDASSFPRPVPRPSLASRAIPWTVRYPTRRGGLGPVELGDRPECVRLGGRIPQRQRQRKGTDSVSLLPCSTGSTMVVDHDFSHVADLGLRRTKCLSELFAVPTMRSRVLCSGLATRPPPVGLLWTTSRTSGNGM